MDRLEQMELGMGFAFLGREHRLEVGDAEQLLTLKDRIKSYERKHNYQM